MREILIPTPENASSEELRAAREQADEILERARGELDKVKLKQIFIRFKIDEADKQEARTRAEEVLKKSREKNENFAQLARRWSDDKDTSGRGGYLGFLDSFVKKYVP